jgi:hypothetical protein
LGTDDDLTVDDLVSQRAADELGPGRIPTKAILVVETMSEEGTGLRFVTSNGLPLWQAIGMMRSALRRMEDVDAASWDDDE